MRATFLLTSAGNIACCSQSKWSRLSLNLDMSTDENRCFILKNRERQTMEIQMRHAVFACLHKHLFWPVYRAGLF